MDREKRAFTDEAIQDTLPNENITLTERHPLDLTSSIGAQEQKKGFFLNPEIGMYLAQTSMNIHEGRRAEKERDFMLENTDVEAQERLRTFKNAQALEYRAQSFTNDLINQKKTSLTDELNRSDYTEVHRQDILKKFRSDIEDQVAEMYKKGYYYPANQIRAWAQQYYEENIDRAISSDLNKDANRTEFQQEIDYVSAVNTSVSEKRCTTMDFDSITTDRTLANMMSSIGIKDYRDVENNNKYYNVAARMFAKGIYENFRAGIYKPDEALAELIKLGSQFNTNSFIGYRLLNRADAALIEDRGVTYFERFYGAKVLDLTDEQLSKTDAGRRILKSGLVDELRNSDGTVRVVQEKWDVAFDEATQNTIAEAINNIKKNKVGAVSKLALDAFDQLYKIDDLKKGVYSDNPALYGASAEQMYKDLDSSYETFMFINANSDSETFKTNAALQFKDEVVYGHSTWTANKIIEYSMSSGEFTPGKGMSTSLIDKINAIEDKYITKGEYIGDEIPELVFDSDGVVVANLNVPTKYLESLAVSGNSVQVMRRAWLAEVVKAVRGSAKYYSEGNGAAFVRTQPEYYKGLQDAKSAILPTNLLRVNKEAGSVAAVPEACSEAGKQIRALQEFTNGYSGVYDNNLASSDTLKEMYTQYKRLETETEREQYALAAGMIFGEIGTADVFMGGNYADLSSEQRAFYDKAIGYALIRNSSMGKYTDLISSLAEDTSRSTVTNPTLETMSNLSRSNPDLLKFKGLTDKNFQASVYSLVDKYGISNKYRGPLYKLAAMMAASKVKGQKGGGEFDLGDFEAILKSNFDATGNYKFSTGYSTPDGTHGINTQAGYSGYLNQFNSDIKNFSYDKNATFDVNPDNKNGLITLSSGNTLKYPTAGGQVPFTITQSTGGAKGTDALKYKSGIVVSAINTASFTDITSDKKLLREFNTFNKTQKGTWTTSNLEILAQKVLGHMGKHETQEAFLRYMSTPNRPNLDGMLGQNSDVAKFLATRETEEYTKEKQDVMQAELMQAGLSRSEAKARVEEQAGAYKLSAEYVKFAMADMANKNTMSVYHKHVDKPGTYTPGITKWPFYDYSRPDAQGGTGIITSGFGLRKGKWHDGIDVGMALNTPVRPAMSGKVVFAGWNGGYGNCIIVESPNGVMWLYGHLNSVNKSLVGKQVVANDTQLGLSGNTGHSTGPHTHFEKRVKCKKGNFFSGIPVDPITHKDHKGNYLGSKSEDTKMAFRADELFYKGQITQDSVKKARDMGYYDATLEDARYIYDTLLPGYTLTKEDAKAIGRQLGVDIHANDEWTTQASLVSRMAQAGEIFKESNPFNARIITMASIYPGTTLKFVNSRNKVTTSGKTLNDIIAMRRKDGLEKFKNGEWEIDSSSPDLKKWLKPFIKA